MSQVRNDLSSRELTTLQAEAKPQARQFSGSLSERGFSHCFFTTKMNLISLSKEIMGKLSKYKRDDEILQLISVIIRNKGLGLKEAADLFYDLALIHQAHTELCHAALSLQEEVARQYAERGAYYYDHFYELKQTVNMLLLFTEERTAASLLQEFMDISNADLVRLTLMADLVAQGGDVDEELERCSQGSALAKLWLKACRELPPNNGDCDLSIIAFSSEANLAELFKEARKNYRPILIKSVLKSGFIDFGIYGFYNKEWQYRQLVQYRFDILAHIPFDTKVSVITSADPRFFPALRKLVAENHTLDGVAVERALLKLPSLLAFFHEHRNDNLQQIAEIEYKKEYIYRERYLRLLGLLRDGEPIEGQPEFQMPVLKKFSAAIDSFSKDLALRGANRL